MLFNLFFCFSGYFKGPVFFIGFSLKICIFLDFFFLPFQPQTAGLSLGLGDGSWRLAGTGPRAISACPVLYLHPLVG